MSGGATAAELLQHFAVHGRFYEAQLDGRPWRLRSRLEIFDRSLDPAACVGGVPDLVVVMMNPGASRPLGVLDDAGWGPALPDRTQYQLMKLALAARRHGWALRHIRVLNLSDLRTPKSADLFAALHELADDRHSIFCTRRAGELAHALGPSTVPVLRAWGLAPALSMLAQLALKATESRQVLGLTDNGISYRHPLPQRADLQQAWLDSMERQVCAMGPVGAAGNQAAAAGPRNAGILAGSPRRGARVAKGGRL